MKSGLKKISTLQIVLLSTGGMIGSGWLFSPYYGVQTAGSGVILSWVIAAILTLLIGLSFAEVVTLLPIVSGIMRFMGVTHSATLGFLFVVLGWISYVVYLPLEAQSAIQYLGFWVPSLVQQKGHGVALSLTGVAASGAIMVFLTWFNTLHLSKVTRANALISLWKILLPLGIALGMLIVFGKISTPIRHELAHITFEPVLFAITSSGLAFAFTGFQNGLIVANSAANPRRAIPLSVFTPIVIGLLMYGSLSLMFLFCAGSNSNLPAATAPLLGLLSLFGLHYLFIILFADAIVAPLGTANVYTTLSGRILYALSREFFPNSWLNNLNKTAAPACALWLNMLIGACFLLPLPTWTQLVNFLSSLIMLSCLSGPLALIILREKFPHLERKFRVPCYKVVGYLGFCSCSFFVYWSGVVNLLYLIWLSSAICLAYWLVFARRKPWLVLQQSWFLLAYILLLYLVAYCYQNKLVIFPYDHGLIIVIGLIFTKIFLSSQAKSEQMQLKLQQLNIEISQDGVSAAKLG